MTQVSAKLKRERGGRGIWSRGRRGGGGQVAGKMRCRQSSHILQCKTLHTEKTAALLRNRTQFSKAQSLIGQQNLSMGSGVVDTGVQIALSCFVRALAGQDCSQARLNTVQESRASMKKTTNSDQCACMACLVSDLLVQNLLPTAHGTFDDVLSLTGQLLLHLTLGAPQHKWPQHLHPGWGHWSSCWGCCTHAKLNVTPAGVTVPRLWSLHPCWGGRTHVDRDCTQAGVTVPMLG